MGWLSNKILRLSVNSQRKEMTIFVDTLRGMDPDEIAIGLAFATNFRNTIDLTLPSNLSLLDPFALVEAYPTITYENANGIKKATKKMDSTIRQPV
ncbi:hypothetical protein [Salidesulfovibrio brasiliensis]|uniref:hypothetical protein n=1 Tax=Salidesulfovibrio brasiliensis TaxID=221711 RepID=UPI000B0DC01E|nr:hypothetical protein [Salidesulfovibrio brasiliensis]